MPIFEWDEDKAKSNLQKHKITFAEGATIFADMFSLTIPDPDSSPEELRFIDIGISEKGRILVVVYAERGENIRIISVRKAARQERKIYMSNNKKEEMPAEYDFSKGVRGKHFKAMQKGYKTIIHKSDGTDEITETRPIFLDADLQAAFPNSEAVNKALRKFIEIQKAA